jgi:myo-inositol-1(or 4)-monophosphatase
MAGCVVEFAGGPGTWVTRTYTASLGGGAKLNGSRSIRTSDVTEIEKSLLASMTWQMIDVHSDISFIEEVPAG